MEQFLFSGKYNEGIDWINKEKSKKQNLALLNQYEGDFYKLKGDLDEALLHWKESNLIRSKQYEGNDYHLAWNYALLSNYYFEKIETGLAKKYADSCAQLIQHLTSTQEQEIEIFKIWNILAQSNKQHIENNFFGALALRKYDGIRAIYSKSKQFILDHKLPKYYLAKIYHLIGNSYVDNIHAHLKMNSNRADVVKVFDQAESNYHLALDEWTRTFGVKHHERAKTLYLIGMLHMVFTSENPTNKYHLSSDYFDQAIQAYGIDPDTLNPTALKKIPNKEDALQCLRFKTESLLEQVEELNAIDLLHSAERISRQSVKLWEITYDEFKSNNTNQLLGIYNLVPFKSVIQIELLKRTYKLKFSLDRLFRANEKLKYYDLNANTTSKKGSPVSIKAIQHHLKKGEVFLEFLSNFKNAYFVLVIKKNKLFLSEINTDITWFIHKFNQAILDQEYWKTVRYGEFLKQIIFHDIHLQGLKRLIICPDGDINQLAFEALLYSTKKVRTKDYRKLDYLMKHIDIEYTLSPGIFLQKRPSIPMSIVAFAPFNKNQKYAELPFSARLIENLEGDHHTIVFKNQKATAEHFLNAKTPILHFSGHGLVDSKSSSMSSLVFSNRRLSLTEISNIRSPQLIVLNACNTSNGKIIAGDGVDGFVRAFHAAGAIVTIANLWEVDDKVSNELFLKFYAAMKTKKQIASLMQDTKLDYIHTCSRSEMAAPYYWAGHRVMGNGEIVENTRSTSHPIFWIAGGLFLVLCISGICRLRFRHR